MEPSTLTHDRHSAPPPAPAAPSIPDLSLLRLIGRGAYGEVWLARTVTGHLRAVKVIRPNPEDPRAVQREFDGVTTCQDVARATPGLLEILHVGRLPDGGFYYVMPAADRFVPPDDGDIALYVPHTLRAEIASGRRLSPGRVRDMGLRLADALAALHRHDILHRDIKPANIVIAGGEPFLADIGLVRRIGDTMTMAGTQGYAPPEGTGTKSADLYSLGMVLYEMLTGNGPASFPALPAFPADWSETEQATARRLNTIILKACAQQPGRRHRSAADLRRELADAAGARGRSTAVRRTRAWTGIAAAALVALVWGLARRAEEPAEKRPVAAFAPANRRGTPAGTLNHDTVAHLLTSDEYEWTTPENLGQSINTAGSEYVVTLTDDGLYMLLAASINRLGTLYECTRQGTNEPFARKLLFRASPEAGQLGDPYVTGDGLTQYCSATKGPGQRGAYNIYVRRRATRLDAWGPLENLGPVINRSGSEAQPFLSRDGLTLLFTARDTEGQQKADIFWSVRPGVGAPWSDPVRLDAAVNTHVEEYQPRLAADQRTLLFTRATPSWRDIWIAVRDQDGGWTVHPLGLPVTARTQCPWLTPDGRTLYFSSDLAGGCGDFDIWRIHRVPKSPAPASGVR